MAASNAGAAVAAVPEMPTALAACLRTVDVPEVHTELLLVHPFRARIGDVSGLRDKQGFPLSRVVAVRRV